MLPNCRARTVALSGQVTQHIFLPDSRSQTIRLVGLGACYPGKEANSYHSPLLCAALSPVQPGNMDRVPRRLCSQQCLSREPASLRFYRAKWTAPSVHGNWCALLPELGPYKESLANLEPVLLPHLFKEVNS